MTERIVVLLLLVLLVVAGSLIVRDTSRQRVSAALRAELPVGLEGRLPRDRPAIIYFHGNQCGACRLQASVLEGLSRDGGIAVLSVDAARESHLSNAFGVMTVPATVVIDSAHRVRGVNLGFRARADLAAQLRELSAAV